VRGDKRKDASKIGRAKSDANWFAERVNVPAFGVIQVVEHDFQSLRRVVWDLVDRGPILALLRRHRYVSLSSLKTRCKRHIIPHVYCTRFMISPADKLMQRLKPPEGLRDLQIEVPNCAASNKVQYCSEILACAGPVPYSYIDWAHFGGWLYCTICGQFMRYQKKEKMAWSYH
jgi:hypothetical protein